MYFFEDVYVTCQECEGRRYKAEVRQVTYRGKDVSQVLQLTVDEAAKSLAEWLARKSPARGDGAAAAGPLFEPASASRARPARGGGES